MTVRRRFSQLLFTALFWLTVIIIAYGLFVAVYSRSERRFLDLREWHHFSAKPRNLAEKLPGLQFEGNRAAHELLLRLEVPFRKGNRVCAESTREISGNTDWTFSVFVYSPYFSKKNADTFLASVQAGEVRESLIVEREKFGKKLTLRGRSPSNGKVPVRFCLEALNRRSKASWARASEVWFSHPQLLTGR